jgi:hypothetical protein
MITLISLQQGDPDFGDDLAKRLSGAAHQTPLAGTGL